MNLAELRLRQRDDVSCGPAAAVVAGALLDPDYRAKLTGPAGRAWFAWEQGRVHVAANRFWPRALGTTPWGMAKVIGGRYGWRPLLGPFGGPAVVAEVERAVTSGWPVAMLVGRVIPRHWVLVVDVTADGWHCYEPSSGEVRTVTAAAVLQARLVGLGYPRAFAVVLNNRSNI